MLADVGMFYAGITLGLIAGVLIMRWPEGASVPADPPAPEAVAPVNKPRRVRRWACLVAPGVLYETTVHDTGMPVVHAETPAQH